MKITSIWTHNKVIDFIKKCRTIDFGIPVFRKYGRNEILATCNSSKDTIPSIIFKNVPEEDMKLIESGYGDWKILLARYADIETMKEAFEAPIVLGKKSFQHKFDKNIFFKIRKELWEREINL